LNPCVCINSTISCGGNETIHLKTIFHRLDFELKNGEKHFKQFYLNNTAISELAENTFEDITFDSIHIDNAINLSLIHTNAFTAINLRLEEFQVSNTSLRNSPPNYDIFTALSLMIEIETIRIVYSKLEEIPENAFRPLMGHQNKLTYVGFQDNIITKIGNNAFQDLFSLSQLKLYSNKIDHIPKNAFKFLKKSALSHLDLDNNLLNSSSFEEGALSYLNGPILLEIDRHNMKYLDQNIFEIFFYNNEGNTLIMEKLDCDDCRSSWLFKNEKFSKQIDKINCTNGKIFKDVNNFKNCAEIL
jgi:hypothetical protein